MTKKTSMTPDAAARIQRHADKHGQNQDFKARAQRAADSAAQAPNKRTEPPKTGKR